MPSWKHSQEYTQQTHDINTTTVSRNRASNKPNCFTVRKWSASILRYLVRFFFWSCFVFVLFQEAVWPWHPSETLRSSRHVHCSVRLSWQNPPCQGPALSLTVVMSYKCSAFSHLNLSVSCPHLCSWRSPLRFTWSKPRLEVKRRSVITNRSKW